MRTIMWKCTLGANWQWVSGSTPHPSFRDSDTRTGTITLPPNPDDWYSCITVTLDGGLQGNAMLRYFQDGGVDRVQARTIAQGQWDELGNIDEVSKTNATGGINLVAVVI